MTPDHVENLCQLGPLAGAAEDFPGNCRRRRYHRRARDDSNRQSQYSRQLKELEKYFGAELLKRGHGPAELTDAGQRLYEIIGHTLSALDEFRLTCAGQPVELRIGAGESLIQWLLLLDCRACRRLILASR